MAPPLRLRCLLPGGSSETASAATAEGMGLGGLRGGLCSPVGFVRLPVAPFLTARRLDAPALCSVVAVLAAIPAGSPVESLAGTLGPFCSGAILPPPGCIHREDAAAIDCRAAAVPSCRPIGCAPPWVLESGVSDASLRASALSPICAADGPPPASDAVATMTGGGGGGCWGCFEFCAATRAAKASRSLSPYPYALLFSIGGIGGSRSITGVCVLAVSDWATTDNAPATPCAC